jgi:hypothetical protein
MMMMMMMVDAAGIVGNRFPLIQRGMQAAPFYSPC